MVKMINEYQSEKHKEITSLIKCIEREIRYRRQVYPSLVARGKKSEWSSKYEIKCMKEILVILHIIERTGFLEQEDIKTQKMIFENTHPELKA